jgi:hypothetical protein
MKVTKASQWVKTATLLVTVGLLSACAYLDSIMSPAPSQAPARSMETAGAMTASTGPVFYDFKDIPTPRELTFSPNDSYVFEAGKTKAGFIVLRCRVEMNSIFRFFESALPHEGWNKKGSFRSGRSVLIFEKPDKACIINIYESNFLTYVEIYVIPYEEQT